LRNEILFSSDIFKNQLKHLPKVLGKPVYDGNDFTVRKLPSIISPTILQMDSKNFSFNLNSLETID